ncbi:hypothetical protein GGR54DRAFT_494687 [Hypoxylon sp. NC1633]|nr:hypothetical protein GGR54DRAFT_494687 [Hypoxylon sp. NC1633]
MFRHAFNGIVFLLATLFITDSQGRLDHVRLEYRQLSWNSTTTPSPTSSHASGVTPSITSGSTTDLPGSTTDTPVEAIIVQQTTTLNGQVQIFPVMLGRIFTSPVTLESPNPTPLDPTGEPAKSSAKTISSSYSSISGSIASWLQVKNQVQATAIRGELQEMLPKIGSMVNNLPDGDQKLAKSGGCQTSRKTRSRDLAGNLLGSLNNLLCSTTVLLDNFTRVMGTTDPGTISNLANGIKTTISGVNGVLLGIVTGGGGTGGGNEDGGDQSKSSISTQSTDTTTSSSTTSTSCTNTVTATYQSVFCTSTTVSVANVQRRQNCSSLIYTTVTGCSISNSATTTTTAIQAQKTEYSEICSPDTCGTRECSKKRSIKDGNLKRRDWEEAPNREVEPKEGEWADDSNYKNSDRVLFIRGEVHLAYINSATDPLRYASVDVSVQQSMSTHPTTSYSSIWADKVFTMALTGLSGCTAIVVISNAGVWVIHFWETPSFTGYLITPGFFYDKPAKYIPPIFEPKDFIEKRFKSDVLNAIHKGTGPYHVFGLDDFRGDSNTPWGRMFDDDKEPAVWIFTPQPQPPMDDPSRARPKQGKTGQLRYKDETNQIIGELKSIFPDTVPINVYDYHARTPSIDFIRGQPEDAVRRYVRDETGASFLGKILIQYKPAPVCDARVAKFRLWFQRSLLWDQGVSQPEGQILSSNTRKRDNSSSCDLLQPSSTSTPTTTSTTASTTTSIGLQGTVSLVSCFNTLQLPCYNAVSPDTAHSKSDKFCSNLASTIGISNGQPIQHTSNDFSDPVAYHWRISQKPDRVGMDGQSILHVRQRIATVSCRDAMRVAFDDCINGGHGGKAEDECLEYEFSPVNQGGNSSCSLPFA